MSTRCLDTYALIEIKKQNPAYEHITTHVCVVPEPVLAEFWTVIAKEYGVEKADELVNIFSSLTISVSKEVFIEAARFRFSNRKSGISFFDAVGYIFAQQNKMVFVTGDKEFAGRPGVEYVK